MFPPGYGDTVQVEYMEPEPLQEPVPVLIVNEGAKERRDWDTNTYFIDATRGPQNIVNEDTRRTTLYIRNNGPNTVYLAPRSGVNVESGYPLAMNETFTMDAETAVWGVVAPTESASLRLRWEFAQTLPNK
jgi:hypothetical protein